MFAVRWFEAGLITWYRRKLRRVTFSESRSYENMLRKEYIQRKEKGNLHMGLFTFIPGVQYLDLCREKNLLVKMLGKGKWKVFERSNWFINHVEVLERLSYTIIYINIVILLMMKYTFNYFLKSRQISWSYSGSSFTRSL